MYVLSKIISLAYLCLICVFAVIFVRVAKCFLTNPYLTWCNVQVNEWNRRFEDLMFIVFRKSPIFYKFWIKPKYGNCCCSWTPCHHFVHRLKLTPKIWLMISSFSSFDGSYYNWTYSAPFLLFCLGSLCCWVGWMLPTKWLSRQGDSL